jgi:hypothetical protein
MGSSSDLRDVNMSGITKEKLREELVATFDALSKWRDEIENVNERCVRKVLDQMSSTARAMGWSDQAIRGTREYLERTSKMQTELIDQLIEGWKRQLKSPVAPMAFPRGFADQIPGLSGSMVAAGMPEFNPLAPWTFWLQTAEMWQRAWMPEAPRLNYPRSH